MEIQGKSCIVTGASSGIGAATARHLYGLGAKVTLAARRTERIEALARELPGTRAITTDVTNPAHIRRLVSETIATFGGIDVLVNNAGQGLHVPLLQLDPIDLRAVFELNVVAPLVATQSVLPAMVAIGGGAVVNVSSASTLHAALGMSGYDATKSALNSLSETGRLELADKGVNLSVVYPSGTDTEFYSVLRAGHAPAGGGTMGRDRPELVAQAIVFAIRTGEAHVLVNDPPQAIDPAAQWCRTPTAPAGEEAEVHLHGRDNGCGAGGRDSERGRGGSWDTDVILVTAASGQTGRSVIPVLTATGERVRAFDIAPLVKELGEDEQVEAVVGDLSDAAAVSDAMDGVRTVVYIGPILDPQEADLGHNVVSAARRAQVEHFVFFSVIHPQLEGLPNHTAKLEVERHLLMSRLPFTILQPTYYMQNVNVELSVASGVLRQPFDIDTKVALIDLDNLATITAQVVTKSASHLYATYQLCGADLRSDTSGPRSSAPSRASRYGPSRRRWPSDGSRDPVRPRTRTTAPTRWSA